MKKIIITIVLSLGMILHTKAENQHTKETFSNEHASLKRAFGYNIFIISSVIALKILTPKIKPIIIALTSNYREELKRLKEQLQNHLTELVSEFSKNALVFKNELTLSSDEPTCYDVLGLTNLATEIEIRKAHRKLSLKYHPDRSEIHPAERAHTLAQLINEARDLALQDLKNRS